MGEGRVSKLERAAARMAAQADVDALAKTVSGMASTSAVSKVEDQVAAMAAASSRLQSYVVDGVTDATGMIVVDVTLALLECTVIPEGAQVAGKPIFHGVVRPPEISGKTARVSFAFWEVTASSATITVAVGSGTVPAAAKPAPKGISCRFRVTGRLPA